MFQLSHEAIQPPTVPCPEAGGFVSFVGRVRDHAQGRRVLFLEYEAYEEMALREGERLLEQAVERFGLLRAAAIHRLGKLAVGEAAVWIEVGAAHRREAFLGCEWIIDQLKVRVPIWKRETFANGDSGWVGINDVGLAPAGLEGRYRRQMRLPEVGHEGQDRLAAATVLVVGAGGLGCGCLPALAGAGIGTIGIADGDEVALDNLHRQLAYGVADVGRPKVERAAAFLRRLNPDVRIVEAPGYIDASTVDQLVGGYDWIVDGTDSLSVKRLLNRACKRLGKTLVTASIHRFEGHVMTVTPGGPCLECLFPEWPEEGCVGTCAESGVLGVVPAIFGQLQAAEVLKGVLGAGAGLGETMAILDLRDLRLDMIRRCRRAGCLGCQGVALPQEAPLEVRDLAEAKRLLGDFVLIDVRELGEAPPLERPHRKAPASSFDASSAPGPAVLCCASGVRSLALVRQLRALGRTDVLSLRGGLPRA